MNSVNQVIHPYQGKVALVTGANRGLGRETTRQLAELGMTVFAAARDEERGKRTVDELRSRGLDVRFLQLDVTSEISVQSASDFIGETFGHLDVLINNAGIIVEEERPSMERPPTEIKPSTITAGHVRETYEVNVMGVVAVTRAMLPWLRRSSSARIVNISSALGSMTLRADPEHIVAKVGMLAYDSSKSALNAITLHYANELRGTGILVNSADPGFVATDLNNHTGYLTVEDGAAMIIRLATLNDDGPTGLFLSKDGPLPW